ncbi:DUF2061 domain-containing protein [Jhaorihella thermophila]|uniref:Uncharacterized membrane protein n=1 Tax=Jhaorihella thermophila TaxID=488547 RepID=A0A1H5TLY4_9RHOB|nr:DUF2061 domain-containing protein [Jhaorihella thermophila]SEF63111.1 Uncharacterized membrane protein [Jhaorihella thermophila]
METRRRSLVKAVLWNVIGLVVMAVVGLIATGSAAVGGTLAVVNTVIGLVMYVIYERIWARIKWGRHA